MDKVKRDSQVCVGPVKRATGTDFGAKRKLLTLLSPTTFRLMQHPLLQDRFDFCVVKCTTLLYSTCFAAKQVVHVFVARFIAPLTSDVREQLVPGVTILCNRSL